LAERVHQHVVVGVVDRVVVDVAIGAHLLKRRQRGFLGGFLRKLAGLDQRPVVVQDAVGQFDLHLQCLLLGIAQVQILHARGAYRQQDHADGDQPGQQVQLAAHRDIGDVAGPELEDFHRGLFRQGSRGLRGLDPPGEEDPICYRRLSAEVDGADSAYEPNPVPRSRNDSLTWYGKRLRHMACLRRGEEKGPDAAHRGPVFPGLPARQDQNSCQSPSSAVTGAGTSTFGRRAGATLATGAVATLRTGARRVERAAPSARRNTATTSTSCPACSAIERAAVEASSTSAAFCWVVSSICTTVWLTCSMPAVCSCEAAEISDMMSVTRCTLLTISPIVVPAFCTR